MYDYGPVTKKAAELIKKYGSTLNWNQKEAQSPDDQETPWKSKPAVNRAHSVLAVVLPASSGASSLFGVDLEKGEVEETSYRYLIVAAEGRLDVPSTGDTFGPIEGKEGVVLGTSTLCPVNDGKNIIYEVGVKL